MKNEKSIFLVVRQMDVLQVILGFCSGWKAIEDCANDLERNGEIFEFGFLC
jgi:hypothetical protein